MNPDFMLDWWPVGQGLFASGFVIGRNRRPLSWVYDCGTTSRDDPIGKALYAYRTRRKAAGASFIHLAVLSHFDNDHISGFVRLIRQSPVRTILLPYIPVWQRLIMAIEQGVAAGDPLLGFFLDPVAYLTAIAGGEIGEIILVPGFGPDDPPPAEVDDFEPGPEDDHEDVADSGITAEAEPVPSHAADFLHSATPATAVRFLRQAGRLVVPGLWEFVPYNDAELAPKATPSFIAAAMPLIAQLRDHPDQREDALAHLKELYDTNFGGRSKERNLISLFLYSGPVSRRGRPPAIWTETLVRRFPRSERTTLHRVRRNDRMSQMHTGDGSLNTAQRYRQFERFYRSNGRLARSGIFQVMHHGSRDNSQPGLAGWLRPLLSVVSSDPSHKGFRHPHDEVKADFAPYDLVQVDRSVRLRLDGFLDWG